MSGYFGGIIFTLKVKLHECLLPKASLPLNVETGLKGQLGRSIRMGLIGRWPSRFLFVSF